jgi:hypothetical protein
VLLPIFLRFLYLPLQKYSVLITYFIYRNIPFVLRTSFTSIFRTYYLLPLQKYSVIITYFLYRNILYLLLTSFTGIFRTCYLLPLQEYSVLILGLESFFDLPNIKIIWLMFLLMPLATGRDNKIMWVVSCWEFAKISRHIAALLQLFAKLWLPYLGYRSLITAALPVNPA